MLDFLLQRAKAVVALAVPAITAALLKSIEGGAGLDIPSDWEVAIISAVTGLIVHQVPNKSA